MSNDRQRIVSSAWNFLQGLFNGGHTEYPL